MFFSRKKPSSPVSLSWLNTDIHSHLLPGVDDGAPDMETSLYLIGKLADLGYKKIITTPHVLWDMYQNTTDIILQKTAEVNAAIREKGIDIEFSAAAEYYIDEHFASELQKKTPLLALKDKLVLVEFSMVTAPFDLKEVLFEMQMQGYEPIIAHPERYIYMKRNSEFFEDLKDIGCHFQVNLLSLAGYYGKSVQELAEYLLKNEFYTYAGTDMHNDKHCDILRRANDDGVFSKLRESNTTLNHLL